MKPVECPTCGKRVQAGRGNRCPECNNFLHPDPIKRQEAELADHFRELIRAIHDEEWIPTTSYQPPPPDDLDAMSLEQLVEEVNKILTDLDQFPGMYKIMVIDLNRDLFNSIFRSYVGLFSDVYLETLGVLARVKQLPGTPIRFLIWFLSDTLSFLQLRKTYYRGSAGAIFLYDRTQQASFERLPPLIEEFERSVSRAGPLVLLGYEPETEVTWVPRPQDVQALTDQYGMSHYEVYIGNAIKTHEVIDQIFHSMGRDLLQRYLNSK